MTVFSHDPHSELKKCISDNITVKQVQLWKAQLSFKVFLENDSNRGVIAEFIIEISKKTYFEICYIDEAVSVAVEYKFSPENILLRHAYSYVDLFSCDTCYVTASKYETDNGGNSL